MQDLEPEIEIKTTRSGGRGGQNVNKVETAVIAFFNVSNSTLLTEDEKTAVLQKLSNRINKEGQLVVRSQTHRTQLANKQEAIQKITDMIRSALHKKKLRIATRPSRKSKEKRLEQKKNEGEKKQSRKKLRPKDLF